MLYHVQVFWPEHVHQQVDKLKTLRLSRPAQHARREARQDRYGVVRIPSTVHVPNTTVFEAETDNRGEVTKLVLRQVYDDQHDMALVIRPTRGKEWRIITVWLNERTDSHKTLDTTRYAQG